MTARPTRVLHTLSAIASGGVEVRHREIALQLGTPGFEHRFIGTEGGPIAKSLEASGIHVRLLGPVTSILSPDRYLAATKLARSWRPDLVHGAVMEGSTMGVYLAQRLRVPMIYEETSDPQNRRPMGHALARLIATGANRCVAVSPSVGTYLTEKLRVPGSKVEVIPNGVRRPEPIGENERTLLRSSLGVRDTDVVIGTVCRLVDDHKHVSDLIAAFAAMVGFDGTSHLVIVGSGPDKSMLEALAAGTGVSGRIHFVGQHVPADPYYGIMDIFALVSSREAFGLVAAEAMRAGLPVVATAVGGLASIVENGRTGYLVQPGALEALRQALERLASDNSLRRQMGEEGRIRADRLYSLERYLRDVGTLYARFG